MIKKILLSICIILSFTHVNAQTTRDSTVRTAPDSAIKHTPDSTKHSADMAVNQVTDTSIKKAVAIVRSTPDSSAKHSPLETLTYEQYNALLKGEDLYNMDLPARLNHFPMPDGVIKHKKQLDLSPIQISKITAIAAELHRKRVEMGGMMIKNEQALYDLFKNNKADEGSVIFYTNRYGLYQGELRGVILLACYNTERLLSPAQVKLLERLENHK